MTSIRCSSLNIASCCPGAPALLASALPETNGTRTGTIAHAWIRRYLETSRGEANEWLIEAGRADLFDELQDFVDWYEEVLAPTLPAGKSLSEVEHSVPLAAGLTLTGHIDRLIIAEPETVVIDWKHGKGQRWILPPLADDLQMLGYAVQRAPLSANNVRVIRALVSDLEMQEMALDRAALDAARERITAIAREVAANPDERTPGPHCDHCLARRVCTERLGQVDLVLNQLVPHKKRPIAMTVDQARRWALARGAIRDCVEEADALLRAHLAAGLPVEQDGKRLALVGSGTRDKIVDARGAISELRAVVGDAAADAAISTSKGAIEKACKAAGHDSKAFVAALRAAGAIAAEPCERQIRWVKA